MNEDTTRDLNTGSFEERVLAELAAMRADIAILHKIYFRLDERLSTLEEKADRRLQETRPIWENVLTEVKHTNKKLDIFAADTYEMRTDFAMLDRRVMELERTPR